MIKLASDGLGAKTELPNWTVVLNLPMMRGECFVHKQT